MNPEELQARLVECVTQIHTALSGNQADIVETALAVAVVCYIVAAAEDKAAQVEMAAGMHREVCALLDSAEVVRCASMVSSRLLH